MGCGSLSSFKNNDDQKQIKLTFKTEVGKSIVVFANVHTYIGQIKTQLEMIIGTQSKYIQFFINLNNNTEEITNCQDSNGMIVELENEKQIIQYEQLYKNLPIYLIQNNPHSIIKQNEENKNEITRKVTIAIQNVN